jgi:hypothetical protein
MREVNRFVILAIALGITWGQTIKPTRTDTEIKQTIIKVSIASSAETVLAV